MRSLPLRGRGGVGLVDFALMLLYLTAVGRGVPLCVRQRGLLLLRWRRFWRRRAGVDAGRALCPRSFRPHPNPSPKGKGAVPRGKRQQLAFRLRCFAQVVRLCEQRRGLWRLRWRRFCRCRAGVGVERALYRCQKLRCFVCCPQPGPPPRGEGVEPWEKRGRWIFWLRRFGRVVRRDGQRRGLLLLR